MKQSTKDKVEHYATIGLFTVIMGLNGVLVYSIVADMIRYGFSNDEPQVVVEEHAAAEIPPSGGQP